MPVHFRRVVSKRGRLVSSWSPSHPVPCRSPSGGRAGCFTSGGRAARWELHVDLSSRGLAPSPDQLAARPGSALNIGLSSNNSTLSVAGAMGSHGECLAPTRMGATRGASQCSGLSKWQWGGGGVRDLKAAVTCALVLLIHPASLSISTDDTDVNQGRN